jgi:hypothetical protein
LKYDDFINESILVHGNTYDYSLINYNGAHSKVKIICKNHGIFEQSPNGHLSGAGCPICKESKGERDIRIYLTHQHY